MFSRLHVLCRQFAYFRGFWESLKPWEIYTMAGKTAGTAENPARPQNCSGTMHREGSDKWEYLGIVVDLEDHSSSNLIVQLGAPHMIYVAY